eukprot:TRINITY_DN1799_c0_g1_i1.p1 TRINITY_DN1799_c0_g1~~TRINITY_DN1799_c0_g1_i1.p1  ORF type:complete len:199 (+),score=68.43 TRINITY_DN1799_c0_g1_i1:672-1268(+)
MFDFDEAEFEHIKPFELLTCIEIDNFNMGQQIVPTLNEIRKFRNQIPHLNSHHSVLDEEEIFQCFYLNASSFEFSNTLELFYFSILKLLFVTGIELCEEKCIFFLIDLLIEEINKIINCFNDLEIDMNLINLFKYLKTQNVDLNQIWKEKMGYDNQKKRLDKLLNYLKENCNFNHSNKNSIELEQCEPLKREVILGDS